MRTPPSPDLSALLGRLLFSRPPAAQTVPAKDGECAYPQGEGRVRPGGKLHHLPCAFHVLLLAAVGSLLVVPCTGHE